MPPKFVPDALAAGIPPDDVRRLFEKIAWLWANRKLIQHSPLKANLAGFFKRRLGDYRIIYTYDGEADDMVVHLVAPRDIVYKILSGKK